MSALATLDPMTEYEVLPSDAPTLDGFDDGPEGRSGLLGLLDIKHDPAMGRHPARPTGSGFARGEAAPTDRPAPRAGRSGTTIESTVASLPLPLVELVERALAAVANALAEPPLDEDLWGSGPDRSTAVHAAINSAVADWLATDALRRAAVSAREAADRLKVPLADLRRWAGARSIVAFEHAGEQWFPEWQFDAGVERDQLARVWERFPGDAIWFSEWVHQPQPVLGGLPAIDVLREQDVDSVLAAVDALTA